MTETRTLEAFRAKFRVEELNIIENHTWTWSVRPGQPTLGAGILSLNRHAGTFSDVTAEEMQDLAELVTALESAVSSAFDQRIMNYLMLMMVDHHVHYHVIPRYEGVRSFDGREWVDNGWPALPMLADSQHPDNPGLLHLIRDTLQSNAG
ncbi:MAG: HIT family protein [Xanthomonadales bacterium]|nr:HIT family protein [Gammaproteobacteria bacterium]MBT8053783.1 HIT family protein [Gammaproteobacteria bacterium]NND57274.1 HIT family protein [Xanthomonadales bacterium]NNK51620.1 HIT family protein [Xanthomonadales bacterium]